MTPYELAQLLGGKVLGDANIDISMISSMESPKKNTILYVEKKKHIHTALNSSASAILVQSNISISNSNKPIIQVENGKLAFIKLLSIFQKKETPSIGIHPTAIIGDGVLIGDRVSIMPYSVLMDNVVIEDDVVIHPNCYIGSKSHIGNKTILYSNVTIERGSILGSSNIIHSGTVIGADGFGYYDVDNVRYKIPQLGIVRIGNNVEIGANTTIDRATIDETQIGSDTKIDNLVQIAHNCIIGKNCYIASQVGIAGSCRLGDAVTLAGQVGIADHVHIEDNVVVLGKSGVTHSIKAGEVVLGFPARPVKEAKKILIALSKLPQVVKDKHHKKL